MTEASSATMTNKTAEQSEQTFSHQCMQLGNPFFFKCGSRGGVQTELTADMVSAALKWAANQLNLSPLAYSSHSNRRG